MTIPVKKAVLKAEPGYFQERLLKGNYQALLKCWDDNADKVTLDYANATEIVIFQDLGMAEIRVGGGGGLYPAIIEVRKLGNNKTEIKGYSVPTYKQTIDIWMGNFETCSRSL